MSGSSNLFSIFERIMRSLQYPYCKPLRKSRSSRTDGRPLRGRIRQIHRLTGTRKMETAARLRLSQFVTSYFLGVTQLFYFGHKNFPVGSSSANNRQVWAGATPVISLRTGKVTTLRALKSTKRIRLIPDVRNRPKDRIAKIPQCHETGGYISCSLGQNR